MQRLLVALIAAALSLGAMAADKPSRARVNKASMKVQVDRNGEPLLRSASALVLDPASGNILYAKNADQVAPIASLTKIMTAMVVLDAKLDLEEPIEITAEDIDQVKNTSSRLPVGTHFRRDDLLRLALMASDNRAASALGRNYPGGIGAFVDAMNAKARSLGLSQTHYVDSSGLAPGNVSTPQDLAKLVAAASKYALISEYSTTPAANVTLPDSKRALSFVNTNALVRGSEWNIGLSKTGYISESGKCLVMQAMIANQPVVIVLLDSWGRLTRIGDANRIKRWLEKNAGKLVSTPMRSG